MNLNFNALQRMKISASVMAQEWTFNYKKVQRKLEKKEQWEAIKRGREEREEQNKLGREGTLGAGRHLFKSGFCCQ